MYLGLWTAAADAEAGTVTEVTTVGTAYARQAVTFAIPASGITSNSGAINFPVATASYGTVTHWGLYDDPTTGNLLYWASLDASIPIGNTDQITFPTGNIVVQETGNIVTTLANALLNHVLRHTAYTPVATVYGSLLTAITDGASGNVTEVTGGSYARQSIAFSAAAGGAIANSAQLTYPTATADWGTVVGIGVQDALTVGNLLAWKLLTTAKTVSTNSTLTVAASALTLTED